MMKKSRFTCVLAVAVVTAAFTGCGSTMKTSPTVHNASASGPAATESTWVVKGQTMTVRLPTKGGSSHSWRLAPSSADNSFVSLEERYNKRDENGRLAQTGKPAWDVFVFRACKTGHTTIEFCYDCLNNPSTAPAKTLALDVDITKKGEGAALAIGSE